MLIKWPRKLRVPCLVTVCIFYYAVFQTFYDWIWKSGDDEVMTRANQGNEKRNLVYIKMIKCGSETLDAMFHRFALSRDLSCVLPVGNKLYLGWPYKLEKSFYRPSLAPDGHFNIISDHAVYSKEIKDIMPSDTIYITSLREPFSQFKSMFNYYGLQEIMGIKSSDPLEDYFRNQEKYDTIYKKPNQKKFCIPDGFSMSKNLMSFNLGFPTGFPPGTPDYSSNKTAIEDWLSKITRTFKFVIIVEYFDESLVIMKHIMNWTFKDILYLARNVGTYHYKDNHKQEFLDSYKKWSAVDYALYQTYLDIFHQRLKEGGEELLKEIAEFKRVRAKLQAFCDNETETVEFEKSKWNKPFVVTKPFCSMLKENLMDTLKALYDLRNILPKKITPSKYYC